MHSKSRNSVIILTTIAVCCVVPMLGMVLRGSASVTAHETNLLQFLATWPEWLRGCSAILAYMFSTVGCIALVAMLAVADHRITRDARIVGRDVIVSVAPIVYVTGVKWLVKRPRPITSEGSGLLPGDPSFPSGHTAAAVIVATMLLLTMRNLAHKRFSDGRTDSVRFIVCRTIISAVALVVVVACSRLLLGLHYPTDVVVSAVVCPLISYAVWCVWDLRDKERQRW